MIKSKKDKKNNRKSRLASLEIGKAKFLFKQKINNLAGGVLEMFTSSQLWPYLEAVMTLSTVGLLAFFAIKPTAFAISSLLGQIKAREAVSVRMTNKIENLVAAQNNYFKVEQKATLLDEFYPEKEDMAGAAVQVLGLALSRSLIVTNFNFQPIDFLNENKDPGKLKFSFSAKGSFPDIVRFLSSLNHIYRAAKITSYSLKPEMIDENKINPEVIVVNLQGELGFFPPVQSQVKIKL